MFSPGAPRAALAIDQPVFIRRKAVAQMTANTNSRSSSGKKSSSKKLLQTRRQGNQIASQSEPETKIALNPGHKKSAKPLLP
jgi:hypothetical protein